MQKSQLENTCAVFLRESQERKLLGGEVTGKKFQKKSKSFQMLFLRAKMTLHTLLINKSLCGMHVTDSIKSLIDFP